MARILFIDDDPFTLETLSKAAEVLGHQATTAASGREAFAIIESNSDLPDLIFTDMRLPDVNGADLVETLRSRPETAQIPMYILSASPIEDALERANAAGAMGYLDKPIRLNTLLQIIDKHTSG
jgi:CheY-like chemotaxis protein